MKIAYFDCSSGISGDMCLGALVDAGVPLGKLEKELKKLRVKGYKLGARKVRRSGFRATKVNVVQPSAVSHQQSAKTWTDIEKIIKKSDLHLQTREKGLRIFRRLFEAEAGAHGERFDRVHLHELGAVDCMVDIFGSIFGLALLGIEKIYSSPLNLGSGSVSSGHGILPVPAPATIEILRNKNSKPKTRIYSDGTPFELTTPTGAAIIKELSSWSGDIPQMSVEKIGIGAGDKDIKGKANVLRIFVGELSAVSNQLSASKVTVIETNIDDMNPQIYEHVMGMLFKAGALDVFLTQIIMKKGRPGIKLSVLCGNKEKEKLMEIILRETTSIGLRFYETERKILSREIKEFRTELGRIKFKVSKLGGKAVRITPEYEDCKRLAKRLRMPLVEVMKRIQPML